MNQISEWVLAIMAKFGYLGIIFAMFAENVFPPIPSEVIMPAAGFAVARGDLNLLLVIVAGTLGSVLGALPLYYFGSLFNKERLIDFTEKYGKYVFVKPDDVISADDWFNKHGKKAVFFGRMVPGIRSLISIPAGMNKMPLLPFIILTTAGAAIWTTLLTLAGYHFGQNYEVIEKFLAPYSKIFLGAAIVIVIIWLLRRRMSQSK
ncbi:DedA family protein [Psychrobacter sanguinis]|mgnify:FL=1|uniref:DedA family protein n=1 Tax=Psychrobacter sanguinis TaxID=861445 RepID=UPI00020C985C|nr:DedA family protein [Psychrobacter sanguinis]EGK11546.1 DedA family protein [Psychrobacter sp. 1501(2011)]MCC3307478.1 DedA family protein [Psychrobacter sanguinis]MCC3344701.1 DedA family protein [Psychrobacter sanguinis]MCD9152763.1 DedA family protein [Psychrobacter sanguinis]MDY3306340.1 DedA family protein [Psychrobacter sanguinis]